MSRLNVADLRVESFPTADDGGGDTMVLANSLDNPTNCNCSEPAPLCTLDCVENSRATDYQVCCG